MTSIWVGTKVRLRGIEPEDWEAFQRFDENSADMRSADLMYPPRSAAGYRQWAEEQSARQPADDEFMLAIEAIDGVLVGSVSLPNSDRVAGRFDYGVSIGHEYKRRGYASEAIILVLAYMFGERRYHKCEVSILAVNEPSILLHQNLGFVHEGRRRDHVFFAGRHQDVVLMGITAAEFWDRHGERTPQVVTPR
ncbi:GNAT family N-acetyltransferase [Kibdelosporangium philippinense]|uniref:GNAT family N-acetyltransferase n=1 Tax=Kibdelosporangium philippinense TaxID=211113 RepID=A0ABS8ZER8_9PSEU|nr:GNAT family protein [Kibdelosporangium philippinense]MCE7006315.1 GNAT family N-acetyltransferase [Kibdelosporangium philippinense]